MATQFFATRLFDGHRWLNDALIEVSDTGLISTVSADCQEPAHATRLAGPVVPGMPNLHSHAFQRAMAGLAEHRSAGREDFWSWRQVMYRIASRVDPEQMQAIAEMLYLEMLFSGYTRVCEFHYLHHDADGKRYEQPAELGLCLMAAAGRVGLGMTLLPVLYQQGGFDGEPLQGAQKRYGCSTSEYLSMVDTLSGRAVGGQNVGLCFHSLRAVAPEAMAAVLDAVGQDSRPIHIHISEQTLEVEQCLARRGARPVQWLLDQHDVDERWCLVHATHIDRDERSSLARSGAVAGLCPSTEANLGDGLFPFLDYAGEGGAFGVGSDSQVSVSPVEELRWLEYGQRLHQRRRVLSVGEGVDHAGAWLWRGALRGGARACGREHFGLSTGQPADWLVLDGDAPQLVARDGDLLLDALVFSGNQNLIRSVFIAGSEVIRNGTHPDSDAIRDRFRSVLTQLSSD